MASVWDPSLGKGGFAEYSGLRKADVVYRQLRQEIIGGQYLPGAELTVSLLTQHRVEEPFGLNGGQSGQKGQQRLLRAGIETVLEGCTSFDVLAGDRVVIETPGGGGFGKA